MTAVLRLAISSEADKLVCVVASETNWPEALRAADNAAAITELRLVLVNGLRAALSGRGDVNEAHLGTCPECREEMLALQNVLEAEK